MFYKRNLILFILFFLIVPCTAMEVPAKDAKDLSSCNESIVKGIGKSVGGYFFGLCASTLVLTVFSTLNKKDHSNAYIATALATSFGSGCITNFLMHHYPKKTLITIGALTLAAAGITTYAYYS